MATLQRATLIVTITMAPTFEQGCAEPMPGSLTAISPQFQVGVSAPGSSQPGLKTSLSVVLPYHTNFSLFLLTINKHVVCSHLCCIGPEACDAVGHIGVNPETFYILSFCNNKGHPYPPYKHNMNDW